MPAAIPIAIGVSAGVGLIGAKMSSNAAKNAAATQAQAASEANTLQRQMFEQTRSDQLPWLNAGRGAVTSLSRLMGLDSNPASTSSLTSPAAPRVVQRTQPLSSIGRATPNTIAPRANDVGMVMMRAPDGSQQAVSQDQVGHYEARGAVRV
jgi:hypothetical protein